ncbi:hypothetical protein OESDEN_05447, partial [Oesophagostomum dentatum]
LIFKTYDCALEGLAGSILQTEEKDSINTTALGVRPLFRNTTLRLSKEPFNEWNSFISSTRAYSFGCNYAKEGSMNVYLCLFRTAKELVNAK